MSTYPLILAGVNVLLVAGIWVLADKWDTARVDAALKAAEIARLNMRLAKQEQDAARDLANMTASRDDALLANAALRMEYGLDAQDEPDELPEDYDPTDAEQGPLEQGWAESRRETQRLEWVRKDETTLVCQAVPA